jgi:hypothetical protein
LKFFARRQAWQPAEIKKGPRRWRRVASIVSAGGRLGNRLVRTALQ